jgi:hypothetical protein
MTTELREFARIEASLVITLEGLKETSKLFAEKQEELLAFVEKVDEEALNHYEDELHKAIDTLKPVADQLQAETSRVLKTIQTTQNIKANTLAFGVLGSLIFGGFLGFAASFASGGAAVAWADMQLHRTQLEAGAVLQADQADLIK